MKEEWASIGKVKIVHRYRNWEFKKETMARAVGDTERCQMNVPKVQLGEGSNHPRELPISIPRNVLAWASPKGQSVIRFLALPFRE